jgi:hypothetical protein
VEQVLKFLVNVTDQLSQTLKNLIKSDPKYDNYEVIFLVEEENKRFRVLVMHKTYLHKGILAQALMDKYKKNPFGLSIGDMDIDEPMHKVMRLRNQFALLVSSNDFPDLTWETFASSRLQDYRKSISLLEYLAGKRTTKEKIGEHLYHLQRNMDSSISSTKSLLFQLTPLFPLILQGTLFTHTIKSYQQKPSKNVALETNNLGGKQNWK